MGERRERKAAFFASPVPHHRCRYSSFSRGLRANVDFGNTLMSAVDVDSVSDALFGLCATCEEYSMRRNDILRALSAFRDLKQAEFGIVRIGVFGSVARGESIEASDVDVVVELGQPDLLVLVGIKQELEEILHRPVDVVRYREGMNSYLKRRIEQEAVYV